MSKDSLVKIGDKSITRYSNALVRRAIGEITKFLSPIKEVKIGDQIWMSENLNVDHYRNGDPIPEVKEPEDWKELKTGAWCYYDNDPENGKKYGKLYNWYAVNDPRGLAPEGWHVPTREDLNKLGEAVNNYAPNLKEIGQGTGYGAGNNCSGFSALLSGFRYGNGTFNSLGYRAEFWSSTGSKHTYRVSLDNNTKDIHYSSDLYRQNNFELGGCSVRCVKDLPKEFQNSNLAQNQSIIKEVKIGDQIWMKENLSVDHYRNGDPIPEVKEPEDWKELKTGAWCYYDNDPENGKKYGKLYNWYAVNDPRGLAPEGWHVPTMEEFEILKWGVGGDDNGNALKAVGQGAGTNTSGFSALLSGYRSLNSSFDDIRYTTYFWSSTEHDTSHAFIMTMSYYGGYLRVYYEYHQEYGHSVRSVKDNDNLKLHVGSKTAPYKPIIKEVKIKYKS